MAKVIKCDMCGKEMGCGYLLTIEKDSFLLADICPKERDLCEDCKNKILTIIDSKESD